MYFLQDVNVLMVLFQTMLKHINNVIREDSQIDISTGNFSFARLGGGGLHKNVSQILAIIDFFKQRNYRKNLVSKEEYYKQHNFKPNKSFKLGHIWRRHLHS